MEKIITQALKMKGFTNAEDIVKVILATPNPKVAGEMILGCYEPTFRFIGQWFSRDTSLYFVLECDDLHETVKFKRFSQATKTVYYASKEDREAKVYSEEMIPNYYSSGEIPAIGYREFVEVESIADFSGKGYYSKKPISEDDAMVQLMKMQWYN